MTLIKSHLINAIAQQNRFIRKKSTETVETFLDINKSRLKFGEDVLISGFVKVWLFYTWLFFRNPTLPSEGMHG